MGRYLPRAVPVEAIRWTGDNWPAVMAWVREHGCGIHAGRQTPRDDAPAIKLQKLGRAIYLHTPVGTLRVPAGWWLLLHVPHASEIFALPEDSFHLRYQPAWLPPEAT